MMLKIRPFSTFESNVVLHHLVSFPEKNPSVFPRGCSFLPDMLGMTWHGCAHTCNNVMHHAG